MKNQSRRAVLSQAAGWLALGLSGCQNLVSFSEKFDPFGKKNEKKERLARVDSALRNEQGKLVGDYIAISGLHAVMVEGVGYVNGLDGTGEDPPATPWRKEVLEDMRRRKVENPENLLRSTNSAVVLISRFTIVARRCSSARACASIAASYCATFPR